MSITKNAETPFITWLESLDKKLRAKVISKTLHLQEENYSNCSILKDAQGVKEARIKTASGLRLYYTEEGNQILLLLIGRDKDTQKKDIKRAKDYWSDYKQRSKK